MYRIIGLLAGIALLAGCATSSEPRYQAEVVDVAEYREFLADLQEHLERGKPRELNEREMRRYERLNRNLNEMLAGIEDISELDADQQRRVFNLHEDLTATVAGRDEDQVICRREQTVGTHFRVTQCRTRGQIREDQARFQNYFNDSFVSPMTGPQN